MRNLSSKRWKHVSRLSRGASDDDQLGAYEAKVLKNDQKPTATGSADLSKEYNIGHTNEFARGDIPMPVLNDYTNESIEPISFEASFHANKNDLSTQSFQKGLCTRCRAIRWSAFTTFDTPSTFQELELFRIGESHAQLRSSTCRMCHFFSGFKTLDLDGSYISVKVDDARKFTERRIPYEYDEKRRSVAMFLTCPYRGWVVGVHHSGSHKDNIAPRIIEPDQIDYDVLKNWLFFCDTCHELQCATAKISQTQGLRVIDCESRAVVQAPQRCEYVALSYVWGQRPAGDNEKPCPDQILPPTIEDSIKVTRSLGYKYLWVDRYCIPQEEGAERHAQIRQMDGIYQNAYLTIIAAAGADPKYGLPGVGQRFRRAQARIQLGNFEFVEMFPDTLEDLEASKWITRAWTYQEGFLSRRRLIFSNRQVSFACNQMRCVETIRNQRGGLGLDSLSTLTPTGTHGIKVIREYTKRTLSHDSDALNACLGILNFLCDSNFTHLWGVPITPHFPLASDGSIKWDSDPTSTDVGLQLLWYHSNSKTLRKRQGFPSWSWTSWEGEAEFWDAFKSEPPYEGFKIEVRGQSGEWYRIATYAESGLAQRLTGSPHAPRTLRITGLVPEVQFVDECWAVPLPKGASGADNRGSGLFGLLLEEAESPHKLSPGLYALVPVPGDMIWVLRTYLDCSIQDQSRICTAVMLITNVCRAPNLRVAALLLERHGKHYQRVGVAFSVGYVNKNGRFQNASQSWGGTTKVTKLFTVDVQ